MKQEKILQKNLIFIGIMAISGLLFGFVTGSKSIITDGIVSTVILCSSLLGIYVHTKLYANDNEQYPFGKWRFEYIYNLIRLITLFLIIVFSFFDGVFTIFHYFYSDIVPVEIEFMSLFPYFVIKLVAVACSLTYLKANVRRGNIEQEAYQVEKSSVTVDGVLTCAIIVGMLVFARIAPIEDIADACTLIIVSLILGASIFTEIKHLIFLMIGKRTYVNRELFVKELVECKYPDFNIHDVFIEKQGEIFMTYIHCSFDKKISSSELVKLENEVKALLKINNFIHPRLHFYFVEPN